MSFRFPLNALLGLDFSHPIDALAFTLPAEQLHFQLRPVLKDPVKCLDLVIVHR